MFELSSHPSSAPSPHAETRGGDTTRLRRILPGAPRVVLAPKSPLSPSTAKGNLDVEKRRNVLFLAGFVFTAPG